MNFNIPKEVLDLNPTTEETIQYLVLEKEPEYQSLLEKYYSNINEGNYNCLSKSESESIRHFHWLCYELIEEHLFFPNNIISSYNRLVLGDHGVYIEFDEEHINTSLKTKKGEEYRNSGHCKYKWLETEDRIKIYLQTNIVKYADYKVGKYYVSPYDLLGELK